ncbi:MAG: hypothetical protein J7L95_07340 [Prolixibacteraceae bacterium]|nr:hypothetical protein [Prolixibacteraceae bacterium]
MKRLLILLILTTIIYSSQAQYFQTGQDPASIRWQQINTSHFQLIYPDYFETQAQRLAIDMEEVYKFGSYSLNHQPKKISIILHTQTVKSNGLVAWAPKRAEFYSTPHQDIYPQPWLQQLAVHEFRHVVQVDKINSLLPGIIKLLLGEQGTALVFGAYLPWWFIEGDAVSTETSLSNFGRGRSPLFLMEHKAQVLEKGIFSYDKAYLGSFRDFVPDFYKLGYYLVGTTRAKYGSAVWNSVVTRVGEKPFSLNPFSKALKMETGMNKVQLYRSVFKSLQKKWSDEDANFVASSFKIISPEKKKFTNYKYNHWLNDTTLISYRTTLEKIPAFVTITQNRKERIIFHPGAIFAESVSYRDKLVVWSEQIPNPRWTHSGTSLIRILNLESGKVSEIKPDFKCFGPAISPDKKRVAVVESDFSNNFFLSVYSIETGNLLKRIQTSENNYLFSPKWLNGNELVLIILLKNGKRLAKMNLKTKKIELLTESDLGDIRQLELTKNQLYFICSYSGKNGLYTYDLNTGEIFQIYEPRFGVEYPAVSTGSKKIALSDYHVNGYNLIEIPYVEQNRKPLAELVKMNYPLADTLASQELGVPDFSVSDTSKYVSEKYSKSGHLLNFHSWAPIFVNPETYEFTPGVSLMSQNKLGTAETILGYKWDLTEKTGKFYARYSFKGWYPVFDFEITSGNSASKYTLIEQSKNSKGEIVQQDTTVTRFTWKNTNANVHARVPMNFTKGMFYRLLQPEIQYDFNNYIRNSSTPDKFFEGNFQSFTYRLYYHQLLKQSEQDVYPDFGFVFDASYRHSPFGITNLGTMAALQTVTYLPGLMRNHGIKIYAGVQDKKVNDQFSFSEVIRYPRGWGKINTTQMVSAAFDYKFPLFYPEWSIGGLVYMKRVTTSLFADYASLQGNIYKNKEISGIFEKNITSFGAEVNGDLNFLRFYAPVKMGCRASYLPEYKNVYFEFLFSVDFSSL